VLDLSLNAPRSGKTTALALTMLDPCGQFGGGFRLVFVGHD
jgi:hypothetical protein